MRLFIALHFLPEVQETLYEAMTPLRRAVSLTRASIKWVPQDQLHITLKFLGETSEDLGPQVKTSLEDALKNQKRFPIILRGLGAFPPHGHPQVLWAGLDKGGDPCTSLADTIERAMEPLGFRREERPFHAHITIGRVKKSEGSLRTLLEQSWQSAPIETEAASVELIESVLDSQGPRYTTLAETTLV